MQKKLVAAPALAGLVALPVAGYVGWQVMEEFRLANGPGEAFVETKAPERQRVEAQDAAPAVRELPSKQREAVTLVYGEGMNHAEAADLMGCSEATVSWHVHEAKKRLRQIMAAGEV